MADDAAADRIDLDGEHDADHDPVIMPVDELRDRQEDQSVDDVPAAPRETDRDDADAANEGQRSPGNGGGQSSAVKRRQVERRARRKVVQRLKDRGASDEFIARHQDLIEEKVQELLSDR